MIPTLRSLIWSLSKGDLTLINKAKVGIKLDPASVQYWEAVLRKVEEMTKPKRMKRVKTDPTTDASKQRYRDAKYVYEDKNFHPWCADGHFIEPDYPNCGTKKGLDDFIIYFLKWNGHFANPTNNRGLMIEKDGEKKWLPSGSKKGMQDIDVTLKHPDHEFGIPWKIETKTATDYQSKDQTKFEKRVNETAGVYSLVHNAEDFLEQYDRLMIRKIKQKELF